MRIPICILFFAIATSSRLIGLESNTVGEKPSTKQPAPKLPELSAELIAMGDEDQKFRTILQDAMVPNCNRTRSRRGNCSFTQLKMKCTSMNVGRA